MSNSIKKFFNNDKFPPNERFWLFCMLIFICGYFGGFTFTVRGNLFVNAQTGNLVLLSTGIAYSDKTLIFNTLSLLVIYSLGLITAEFISKKYSKKYLWEKYLLLISSIISFLIGLLPNDLAFEFTLFPIAFLVAMKFATFEKAQGIGMATGFCTNHLKQTCVNLIRFIRSKDKEKIKLSASHFIMILFFIFGTSLAVFLGNIYKEKAIWFASFATILTLFTFNKSIKNYNLSYK